MLLSHGSLFTPGRPQAADLPQGRPGRRCATGCWRSPTRASRDRRAGAADERHPRRRVRRQPGRAGRRRPPTGCLALANEQARDAVRPRPADLGRPFQDLELSYRPLELRSLIEQACTPSAAGHASTTSSGGRRRRGARTSTSRSCPLIDSGGRPARRRASRSSTSPLRAGCRTSWSRPTSELETAYEELQSTNEELETTNEELQSTVEELETTNEELQSTNEELETMNEELQSTNEELQTINDELRPAHRRARPGQRVPRVDPGQPARRRRGGRPGPAGAGLEPAAPRTCGGCARDEVVRAALPEPGHRPAGRRSSSRSCEGAERRPTAASRCSRGVNRRGRSRCRVTCSPLITNDKAVRGVIVVVVEEPEGQPAAS